MRTRWDWRIELNFIVAHYRRVQRHFDQATALVSNGMGGVGSEIQDHLVHLRGVNANQCKFATLELRISTIAGSVARTSRRASSTIG